MEGLNGGPCQRVSGAGGYSINRCVHACMQLSRVRVCVRDDSVCLCLWVGGAGWLVALAVVSVHS